MNPMRTIASAKRVLLQLKHDPRSMALIIVAPCLLMTILKFVYWSQPHVFQNVAGSLLGVFPMLVMFLITSVATLRERTSGTLERVLISPVTKFEFILGYALAFGVASAVQAVIVSTYAIGPLGLDVIGSQAGLIFVAILDALLGLALGLFVSSFAKTEFQAIQFLPIVLLPQLLLSGLLAPRASMPRILEIISNFLPLSYAVDATKKVLIGQGSITNDYLIILLFLIFLLGAGQEWEGAVRRGAKLLHAFGESVVPRVTLITRRAYGGAYVAMNSKALGATRVFAWPQAEVSVMGAVAAVRVLHRRILADLPIEQRESMELELAAEHEKISGGVIRAIEIGAVDEMVEPALTRSALAKTIADAPHRRGSHGNIPL